MHQSGQALPLLEADFLLIGSPGVGENGVRGYSALMFADEAQGRGIDEPHFETTSSYLGGR